jgi:hypothetical protein
MKIFILEDSKHRIKKFKENMPTHILVIYEHAFAGFEHIITHPFDYDVMMLDHDLGHKIFCGRGNSNTGHWFVKAALKRIQESKKLKVIIIHSWNPFGAHRMMKELKNSNKIVIWKPCRWPY